MNRCEGRIAFPACHVIIKADNLDILWNPNVLSFSVFGISHLYVSPCSKALRNPSMRSLSMQMKLSAMHKAFVTGYAFNLCKNDISIVILNQNIKNQ